MFRKWYTADFHIGMEDILRFEKRPFSDIDEMERALKDSCIKRASSDDVILHLGDLYSFGYDRGRSGKKAKPYDFIKDIPAFFMNIRGNHDVNNKVKSVCECMRTNLGKRYPSVSISHYPTYDRRCFGQFMPGDVHLCGHVHGQWKYCLDLDNKCINLNVGVDVWNYRIVSEDELITYLNWILTHNPDQLFRCRLKNRKIEFQGNPFELEKKEYNT